LNRNARPATLDMASSQESGFDTIALTRVDDEMRAGLEVVFPAGIVLLAHQGRVGFHRAYGYHDPETGCLPTQTASLFDLASLTKLFTATTFMTLVEDGRVTLDSPLADVLPEFQGTEPIGPSEDPISKRLVPVEPAFAGKEVDTRDVTFWHLLTHTSGLAAWRSLYREIGDGDERVPLPHHVPEDKRAQRLATIPGPHAFAYLPGQRLVYSDLGLILLGEAIARLSGTSLETTVHDAVLAPLGLTDTLYNPLTSDASRDRFVPTEFCTWRQRRCVGEVHDENAASLGGVAGHAGLFSTARDVAVLAQMYLNGGCYGEARVLSPETVENMTRTQVDIADNPRGLGWLRRSRSGSSSGRLFGPRSYGHTGFTGTSLWIDPDRELIVVLLTNRVYYGRDPRGITGFRPRLHDAAVRALRD
jgi:CubicO group peptidase (beta-lactamase class C family)